MSLFVFIVGLIFSIALVLTGVVLFVIRLGRLRRLAALRARFAEDDARAQLASQAESPPHTSEA